MRALTALALICAAVPAFAEKLPPKPAAPDNHIRVVPYSPTRRYDIIGIVNWPTNITFPKGEQVMRVVENGGGADEDDGPWRGPKCNATETKCEIGSNLPLWPRRPGTAILTVITQQTEGGAERPYAFRLVALPDDAAAAGADGVTFNLIFSGGAPATSAPQAAAAPVQQQAARAWVARKTAADQAAKDALRLTAYNGVQPGVCNYHAQGKRPTPIEPRCPMDNGQWTLMRFPGLSKKPAVYIVGETPDDERLARQHADGDFVVVEEIAGTFRLRLGSAVLDIVNDHFDPAGRPSPSDTVSPGVERDIIQAKQ
nr:TrbG/VirB9 family P-type conjugative transfer protein [uncultured Rhodopila sp.]